MFWSSQIDSLTEFCAGSSVSTFTALAMIRVLFVAVEPPEPPELLVVPELPQPAAARARATSPALSARVRKARNMSHPNLLVDCRQRFTYCRKGRHGRQYSGGPHVSAMIGPLAAGRPLTSADRLTLTISWPLR